MFCNKYGKSQKLAVAMSIFFILAVCAGIFLAGGEPSRAASRIFDELKVKEEKPADADIWDGGAESFDESVAGDENDPYIIDTAKKLAYLAQSVNKRERYPGKWFKLTRDLDLNHLEWTPIGIGGSRYDTDIIFNGHFNGDGHIISNLKVSARDFAYAGLFGLIARGGITDLKLTGVEVGGTQVGGLVGRNLGDGGEISRCSVEGTIICYGAYYEFVEGLLYKIDGVAGGLIGRVAYKGGAIENCAFTGKVLLYDTNRSEHSPIGGLIGEAWGATVSYSTVSADVTGNTIVGGFVGDDYGGRYTACASGGLVESDEGSSVGGFAGKFDDGMMEKCISKNGINVSANGSGVGGLVGEIPGGSNGRTVINECSASGSVTAKDADRVGGFIGDARSFDTISGCVASGDVIGHDAVGGFIGYAGLCDEISDNRASGNVTGEKDVSAMIGRMDQYVDKYITNCFGTGKVTVLE